MICRNCLRAAARSRIPELPSAQLSRFFCASSALRNATAIGATQTAPRQGSPGSHNPPAATPTSTAQPFSGPLTPSAKKQAPKESTKSHPLVKSSVPAGTPLKGLNFLKNQTDPIAMDDSEYPPWLWTILERQEKKGDAAGAGDLFCIPPFSFSLPIRSSSHPPLRRTDLFCN